MPENFTITKISDAEFASCAAALSPLKIPLEQTPLWGTFDAANRGRIFLGSYRIDAADGRLVALGSATLYKQKGRDWIWFKHGPLFASVPNTEVIQKMCASFKQYFSHTEGSSPVFIRLSSPTHAKPLRLPYEHTMYDETVIVDLEKSEADILAGMSQSGRRSLRSALKRDITIEEVTKVKASVFESECYPILKETGSRDGFGIHPLSLYIALLNELPKNARLYIAKVAGKTEAWAITTEYDEQAVYYYGGSSHTARTTDAAYKLHWEIMKEMKARGNTTYDFMGIAGKHFKGLENVTQFKLKFSKNIVRVPITYDLPLQQLKYILLSTAVKTKRYLQF